MLSKLIRPVDSVLNYITMYRLVLYYLIVLICEGLLFSTFGLLPYNPIFLLVSTLFLISVCWIANSIFSYCFEAPTNVESVYISALILALIVNPAQNFHDLIFLMWVGILTIAGKYILAINKKHIFNPAAIAVLVTAFVMNQSASWWVGNVYLAPTVLIGGFLIVRKIRREEMVLAFLLTAIIVISIFTLIRGGNLIDIYQKTFLHSSLLFVAFIMLTEPLTSPDTQRLQLIYSCVVGFLFAPQVHLLNLYTTPEIALVVGNIFSYFVSPKEKLILTLKEKVKLTEDTFDFLFTLDKKLNFIPGQYMEWTFPHKNTDVRGNRRYFTMASSPTEDTLRIGVKFYEPPSSYKREMLSMTSDKKIVAGQRAGEFVLPKDKNQKLVFIAGGIGITPFRSILKYLIDTNQKRDIILFYSNKTSKEIVYKDVFDEAVKTLGIKIVYALTDETISNTNPNYEYGRITTETITKQVLDYKERMFYLSGPRSMVTHYEDVLESLGVNGKDIKTDFFPGFA